MMQDINHYLHSHNQKQILMVDPAVAYQQYPPYERGAQDDIFLKRSNGSYWLGVVWPGVTVFPDWFDSATQGYWNNEFSTFFSPESGVDIDGLWIDMNEPSDFGCNFPCDNVSTSRFIHEEQKLTIHESPMLILKGFPQLPHLSALHLGLCQDFHATSNQQEHHAQAPKRGEKFQYLHIVYQIRYKSDKHPVSSLVCQGVTCSILNTRSTTMRLTLLLIMQMAVVFQITP